MKNNHLLFMVLALAFILTFSVAASEASGPMQVGEHFPITIDSARQTEEAGAVSSWMVSHPEATYIALHFSSFDLGEGEKLIISDATGAQRYTLSGQGKLGAGTFWARHIKGDTAVLEYSRSKEAPGKGFVIDEYVAGNVDLGGGSTEAICGLDDKENAICYASSHPTEYNESRAVARLLIAGSSLCTGWLVSAQNHLITNDHCISSSSDALNTDYEFMAEAPNCSDTNCQLCWDGVVFSGATYVKGSTNLDYTLVQINSGNPAATYGYLEIDNRDAIPGEEIYIPQYPGGRAKELGIFSTDSHDTGGICRVYSVSEAPCIGSGYSDVGYYCDTEGGSSGSPVLARSSHKVISLHHCALCPNRGVPIGLVYAEIAQYIGGGGSCGDGTCDPGEDKCSCPGDCGLPPLAEVANVTCQDGLDNDCDGAADCLDVDCSAADPACMCAPAGAACTVNADCCTGRCHPRKLTCR